MHNYVYVKEFARPDKGVDGFTVTNNLPDLTKIPALWFDADKGRLDILMSNELRKKIGASSFGVSDYTAKHSTNSYDKENFGKNDWFVNPLWILKDPKKNAIEVAKLMYLKNKNFIRNPKRHLGTIGDFMIFSGINTEKELLSMSVKEFLDLIDKWCDSFAPEDKKWADNQKSRYHEWFDKESDNEFHKWIKEDSGAAEAESILKKIKLYEKSPIAYFAQYDIIPEAEYAKEMIDKVAGKNDKDFRTRIYSNNKSDDKVKQFSKGNLEAEVNHWANTVNCLDELDKSERDNLEACADHIAEKISRNHDISEFGYDEDTPEGSMKFTKAIAEILRRNKWW